MSGYSIEDLETLVDDMQRDLTRTKTRLSDLKRALGSLPIPAKTEPLKCPVCGVLQSIRSERALAEHMENLHR